MILTIYFNTSSFLFTSFTPFYPEFFVISKVGNLRIHLQPVNQEFEFLTDELKLVSTQSPYFSGRSINFSVQVGTNIGNHYNKYGDKLQILYLNQGCPEEGLHVADVLIYIPWEEEYFSSYSIPVYYIIPAPNINIIVHDSFHLTFDPANPQNNYISKVPVTVNSTVPSYTINLSLEFFNNYNFLEDYLMLINESPISVTTGGEYIFELELKADLADLWNENKDLILSQFNENILTVEDQIHIGNVYITITSNS